jgi:hypothetical protein
MQFQAIKMEEIMITTEIKATLTTIGTKFVVKFDMDITDHMAREITLAVAALFNDQPSEGEVIRTEKAKTSLKRNAADKDQVDMFKDVVHYGEDETIISEIPLLPFLPTTIDLDPSDEEALGLEEDEPEGGE